MTNKEKFLALVAKEETKTIARAKARVESKKFSRVAKKIALAILVRLDELGWKQVQLAEKMGVAPQQVNKWVKGNENFTIDTLVHLGEVLGRPLIEVNATAEMTKVEAYLSLEETTYEPAAKVFKLPVIMQLEQQTEYNIPIVIAE